MPAAAPAAAAPAAAAEDAPAEEKPKEKTQFNVKLESFDAAAKPKIIREVKAMNPTLTLIDVRSPTTAFCSRLTHAIIYRRRSLWSHYQKCSRRT